MIGEGRDPQAIRKLAPGKLVIARIQEVEGITRTLTCPVVHV